MAASAFYLEPEEPEDGRRRRRSGLGFGAVVVLAAAVLAALLALTLLRGATISEHRSEMKTTRVVLPPPPAPPQPPKPQEKPPEPKPTPLEQPTDASPPPTPTPAQPTLGDNALSAREGVGPSNYGLAVGDGSGARIGGKAGGGDAFAAYAAVAVAAVRQAAQGDRELGRGRYLAHLAVSVDAEGRIIGVRLLEGTGDPRRDARLVQVLTGVQLSQRPPAGLPTMRIELNARAVG